jgi:outer membrane usher protein FimD/PapC
MRYADGQGGYTETLGGAVEGSGIKAMLNAAAAEVAQGGTASKPSLEKARQWIAANRAMLEAAAPSARRIWVGDSWLKAALFEGKFPNGTQIPGVSSWTTKPDSVGFTGGHLNHWHISLR